METIAHISGRIKILPQIPLGMFLMYKSMIVYFSFSEYISTSLHLYKYHIIEEVWESNLPLIIFSIEKFFHLVNWFTRSFTCLTIAIKYLIHLNISQCTGDMIHNGI